MEITATRGVFSLGLMMPGLRRPLDAHELSDGTLRYLSLLAVLLTTRPPEFLVLNEPETSLHSTLIPALARLITEAGDRSQIIVTTHSSALSSTIARHTGLPEIVLTRNNGTTVASTERWRNRPDGLDDE